MRRNIATAVIFSLLLSGCATYTGADGNTHVADAKICDTGICDFLVIMGLAGGAALLASHH